jgi:DNA-binding CsgD family transcriptional regulator
MNGKNQRKGATVHRTQVDQARTRTELTRTRIELAKTRREQAKTRAELAKTRTEQTKTRAELTKTRKGKTGIRTKQVEKAVQRVVHKEFDMHDRHQKISAPLKEPHSSEFADQKNALEQLTGRQREILQLIAESQNTKQIAGILKVSSKTVEYHRRKLMAVLDVHDVPGLVRFAMRAGLVPPEGRWPRIKAACP